MLEVLTRCAPTPFNTKSDLTSTRLAEVCVFSINRTTTGTSSANFQEFLDSKPASLDSIGRVGMLAPLAGILLNLTAAQGDFASVLASTGELRALVCVRVLVLTVLAGFEMESLTFMIEFLKGVIPADKYERLQQVSAMLEQLAAKSKEELEGALKRVDSEEFCPICYSAPIDTSFVPCQHRSCNSCIRRHLLSSVKCFFCNAELASIKPDNAEPISVAELKGKRPE